MINPKNNTPAGLAFYRLSPHATRVRLDEASAEVRAFYRGIMHRRAYPGGRTVTWAKAVRRIAWSD